jgi:hypothetical protein
VYCIDCGMIGHKQYSCLAQQIDRVPSRNLVPLKINVFSNMQSSSSNPHQAEIHQPPSSSPRNNPNTPLLVTSQSHANQTNIHLKSLNSLTPKTLLFGPIPLGLILHLHKTPLVLSHPLPQDWTFLLRKH